MIGTFRNLVERSFDRDVATLLDEGESAEVLIRRFGFHAVDITSCSDGRLLGAVDFILRVPPAVVVWHDAYAGAMFDVEDALHRWESVELRRWREGWPNDASEPTRYLKIGLYHFSSVDPRHQGCAAHGSDEVRAATALLTRLQEFEGAVESTQCCGASVATLLVGVDTDTDAIRVHVPDAAGKTDVDRFVSSATLYEQTASLGREAAKEFIRQAVADFTGVDAADDATEGMRWLCGYLLKNNIGQVDAGSAAGRAEGTGIPATPRSSSWPATRSTTFSCATSPSRRRCARSKKAPSTSTSASGSSRRPMRRKGSRFRCSCTSPTTSASRAPAPPRKDVLAASPPPSRPGMQVRPALLAWSSKRPCERGAARGWTWSRRRATGR